MKPFLMRDVGLESRIAAAVEDGAVPDDGVERRGLRRAIVPRRETARER